MPRDVVDVETPPDGADLDLDIHASHALLAKPAQSIRSVQSRRDTQRNRQEVFELDGIPPIIKSANGNVFWADEQCTRRVGLTSTEARLLLGLLQTDEPEDYNYEEYKAMFEDFGREQQRLQQLVNSIHWWDFESYYQKGIWNARIDWLERMKGPRLWLLFLMARRRRILKQAAIRVMERLREKRIMREAGNGSLHHPSQSISISQLQGDTDQVPLTNDAVQASEVQLRSMSLRSPPVMVCDVSQISENHLEISGNTPSVSEKLGSSFSSGHHSYSLHGHSPVFDKRFQATREHIKLQVELFMPKPMPYITIGWFSTATTDPKERVLQFNEPEDLFRALRKGENECDISRGAHLPLILNTSQESVLSQFFLAYKVSNRHADDAVAIAWQKWVYKNLNGCKNNPLEGRYSLELIYGWSSYRLGAVVGIPLLLSFAIPVWYMVAIEDVITAWTIGIYIVTAAAALIALMTILGSLGDN
ncbi:uncharacterized protein BP5553_03604 [Venustampulla echinocandica]|uniref:Uncharacterized protein n=1 Tax=Venustampulla echinocandica TaxID=2656787 RepID=A0A370TUR8_9HELO|nr:uncharacterized protein BP5553_03604 [Venustampulla echinocandica]RDL39264.1 hypothetical protein BP5553_03604 [Venustampulla echinocandica]